MRYLTSLEIIEINSQILSKYNTESTLALVRNRNSLDYLIEVVSIESGNIIPYNSVYEKAAAYIETINTRHIFMQGNKRTSGLCAFTFLELNGVYTRDDLEDDEISETILAVAENRISFDDLVEWVKCITK